MSGPVGSIGITIISMPKLSVMAKCLSYPGAGHKNLTLSSLHQGVEPQTPSIMDLATVSYITLRLELPNTITLSAGISIMSPISSLASRIPISSP